MQLYKAAAPPLFHSNLLQLPVEKLSVKVMEEIDGILGNKPGEMVRRFD